MQLQRMALLIENTKLMVWFLSLCWLEVVASTLFAWGPIVDSTLEPVYII